MSDDLEKPPATDDAPDDSTHPEYSGSPPAAVPDPSAASVGAIARDLGPAGVLAVAWALLPAVAGFLLLFRWLGPISVWLQDQGSLGLVIFIAGFSITAGFGLLPTYAQAFLAGWVFGLTAGIAGALAGFTGAALVGFVVARIVSRDRIERVIAKHPRASVVRTALLGSGLWRTLGIVTLIRIPPNSPFALTNLALAGTSVPLPTYIIGTVAGMTPRTAIVAGIAANLAAGGATDISEAFSSGKSPWLKFGGIALMIVVLVVIAQIANRALAGLTEAPEASTAAEPPADGDGPGSSDGGRSGGPDTTSA